MMNKLIGERDYSSQEVSHILLGLPLQEDSRVLRSVDCRPRDRHTYRLDMVDDAAGQDNKTPYEKYLERPEGLKDVSYFEFLERYNFAPRNPAQWKEFRYPAKPRVLLYFPRYKAKPGHEQFEDFCRVKLMLNHPHHRHEELRAYDYRQFRSYVEAYQHCVENHEHPDDHYGKVDELEVQPDDEEFMPEPFQEEPTLEDWQEIARMLPDALPEDEPLDLLTRRDIDINYDWSPHIGRYSHDGFENGRYWVDMKATAAQGPNPETMLWSASQSLNPEQRAVYNTFMGHQFSGNRTPLRVQVDGGGGTGKSYMVKILSAHLHRQAARLADRPFAQVKSPILRAAPTGVASNQINGQTLHSLLRLPVDGNFRPLTDQPAVLSNLQRVFLGVNYLVIDEKSMIGLKTLGWIDRRLREIFPERQDEFFGGISVMMIGDFFQLPPVLQKPLYVAGADASLSQDEIYGLNAYLSFNRSVFLSTIQRQAGDDQAAFRQALLELRECRVSEESWVLLSSRCAVKLSQAERDSFHNAVRIYPKKADVNRYNHAHMVGLNSPAIYVSAVNEGIGAEKAESSEAGNSKAPAFHKRSKQCDGLTPDEASGSA
jgi:ATP-dependent DNA helicase PIF1